jgi:hypothetical protein
LQMHQFMATCIRSMNIIELAHTESQETLAR